jgi:hypothetical protein
MQKWYELSEVEKKRLEDFKENHRCLTLARLDGEAAPSLFSLSIEYNTIGSSVSIKCLGCGEVEEISDEARLNC